MIRGLIEYEIAEEQFDVLMILYEQIFEYFISILKELRKYSKIEVTKENP